MTDTLRHLAARAIPARAIPASAFAVAFVLVLAVAVEPAAAQTQASELGRQGLGRAYWHVFASYAVAWVLLFGWVVSMYRRLRRLEERLTAGE